MTEFADVVQAIRRHVFRYASEEQLQEALAAALAGAGLPVAREVSLDRYNRIDLLVDDRFGIEAKVAGSVRPLLAQVTRYCKFARIEGLVVVTTRVRHLRLPAEIEGKPIVVVTLAAAGL